MRNTVPKNLESDGLWNILTRSKRYYINCGVCNHRYDDLVCFETDSAISTCPQCGHGNRWCHKRFYKHYEDWLRSRPSTEDTSHESSTQLSGMGM